MSLSSAGLWVPAPPWLLRCVADDDETYSGIWRMRRAALGKDYFIGALRGTKMRTRAGVFDQFAALLQFPRHFGGNWNAFVDCVNDLDWLCSNGFVLIILDAVHLCVDGDPDEFSLLLRLLAEAAATWAKEGKLGPIAPFHVLLHSAAADAARLHEQVLRAGHDAPLVVLA